MLVRLVRCFAGDIQKGTFASVRLILNGGLDHMAEHITVVGAIEEGRIPFGFALIDDKDMGVTVRALRPPDQVHDLVHLLLQRGIRKHPEGMGDGFEELVKVRLVPGTIERAVGFFTRRLAQRAQIVTHVLPRMWDRAILVNPHFWFPKTAFKAHIAHRNRRDLSRSPGPESRGLRNPGHHRCRSKITSAHPDQKERN